MPRQLMLTEDEDLFFQVALEEATIVAALDVYEHDVVTGIKTLREELRRLFPEILDLPRRSSVTSPAPDGLNWKWEGPQAEFWVIGALIQLVQPKET